MRKHILPMIAIATASLIAAPVAASTIENVSGIYDESGNNTSDAPIDAISLNDFNEAAGNPLLNIVGNTHIYGFVAHRIGGTDPLYTDKWAMSFGTDFYQAVFRWTGLSTAFDGELVVDGTQYELGAAGEIDLGVLTGNVDFNLNPIFGNFGPNPDETAKWELQVEAVPLPAGAFLMLSGLAGFAALRRRQNRDS